MKICYFGNFDPEYARNKVVLRGLEENGVEILFCRTDKKGLGGLIDLFKKHQSLKNSYDIMIIGYSDSRFTVPLARLISRKKIIWDAFYSLYSSYVFDRKLINPQGLKAKYYWFLDWLSCKLANKILLDTNEHIKYFVRVFKEKPQKFMRSFVGTDDLVFYPRSGVKNHNQFLIHFHGKFVPLQGTEHIVSAANILKNEDIVFQLIGQGQEYERVRKLAEEFGLKNINWIDKVKYEELPDFIKKADVCLGIFGNTPKSKLVIPNKVYEAIAMAKPVISGDTPAIREFFTDREDILLCKTADPEDLAKKILELKNNPELAKKIAEGGYKLYLKNATPKIIGKSLTQTLKTYGY